MQPILLTLKNFPFSTAAGLRVGKNGWKPKKQEKGIGRLNPL
jgi:hypothetical protein